MTEIWRSLRYFCPWSRRPRSGSRRTGIAGRIALAAFLVAAGGAVALALPVLLDRPVRALGGLVVLDALGAFILLIIVAVAAIGISGSAAYLRHEPAIRPGDTRRYWAFLLWFVGGLATVPLFNNLGLVWVAIEATTIVSALLVGFSRTPRPSRRPGSTSSWARWASASRSSGRCSRTRRPWRCSARPATPWTGRDWCLSRRGWTRA